MAAQLQPVRAWVAPPALRLLPARRFVHGASAVNGLPATLCWFEAEQIGLLCLVDRGQVRMVRLSLWPAPPVALPLSGGSIGRA